MADRENGTIGAALVTGGAGFIGSHLATRLLNNGRRVLILDNFNDYYDPALKRKNMELIRREGGSDFRLFEGDLRDGAMLDAIFGSERVSEVYHLAAMAGVRPSILKPALYFDVNVNGTVNLLEAAVRHGKPRILFASSSSVYGGSPHIPFNENDPVNAPVSPYAASKKAGELICHTYHHLHGLDISCLRFFTVYGPRQRPEMAIHLFTRAMRDGAPVTMFGDGGTSRDYTYIADVVEGIVAAARHAGGFHIYNIGNNEPVTLKSLIDTIGETLRIEPQIERRPLPPGDVERTWADISLAAKEIGYYPKTGLREGIRLFVEWFDAGADC